MNKDTKTIVIWWTGKDIIGRRVGEKSCKQDVSKSQKKKKKPEQKFSSSGHLYCQEVTLLCLWSQMCEHDVDLLRIKKNEKNVEILSRKNGNLCVQWSLIQISLLELDKDDDSFPSKCSQF